MLELFSPCMTRTAGNDISHRQCPDYVLEFLPIQIVLVSFRDLVVSGVRA